MAAGDGHTTARRGGLGRGLGALIPTGGGGSSGIAIDAILGDNDRPDPVPGATFAQIPVDQITPNPKQPRQSFDDDMHAELKASIGAFGLLQPIVVRRLAPERYELVMGERRWRASKDLGLDAIPAIIRDTADNAMLRDALLENLHRQQLNPLEEAAAYQQLLTEFDTTHDELAGRIGRSRSQVTNTIRLLNLPVPVQRRVAAGVLSAGHARALLSVDDVDLQDELAARIVAEGMSVRATEELVALGGRAGRPGRRPRPSRITAPGLTELGERLSDVFDTRVKVEFGRRKGRIVVEFASVDDLERIVAVMAPTVGPGRASHAATADEDDSGDAWQNASRSTAAEALAAQWADTPQEDSAPEAPVGLHAAGWQRPAEVPDSGGAAVDGLAASPVDRPVPDDGTDGAHDGDTAGQANAGQATAMHDDTAMHDEAAAAGGQAFAVAPPVDADVPAPDGDDGAVAGADMNSDETAVSIVDSAGSQPGEDGEDGGAGVQQPEHHEQPEHPEQTEHHGEQAEHHEEQQY